MIPAEAVALLSITISALAMAILIWSSVRTRRYNRWNDEMNAPRKARE